MWLLSTDRAELQFFNSPEDMEGEYAILSHVWDKEERTYQDVQALRVECAKTDANPREAPEIGYKIRESCRLAERHGWKWIWIDTCCIDKTSSAELSEAINSMFKYYALSGICYAFLRDVSDTFDGPDQRIAPTKDKEDSSDPQWMSDFAKSQWHTRGWTLQELIAPQYLVLISSTWKVLGDKATLAPTLERITGIPQAILRFEQDVADICVARRMSWAARRKTTRMEDQAYCLMGIFGVNMPTLYGEGSMAFYRLQEEIMRKSTDPSLFAWGSRLPLHFATNRQLLAPSPQCYHGEYQGLGNFCTETETYYRLGMSDSKISVPDGSEQINALTFTNTPNGVRVHLPVIDFSNQAGHTIYIALLFCKDTLATEDSNFKFHLALVLLPCSDRITASQPLYHCGSVKDSFRWLVSLSDDEMEECARRSEMKTLYISAMPPFRSDVRLSRTTHDPSVYGALRLTNMTNNVPFRVPPRCYRMRQDGLFPGAAATVIAPETLHYG